MGDIGKLAMMIGIMLSAGVFLFCIIVSVLEKLRRQKVRVAQRISGLTYEKAEPVQTKKKTKGKKKKDKAKVQQQFLKKNKKQIEKIEEELFNAGIKIPIQTFFILWAGLAVGVPMLLFALGTGMLVSLGSVFLIAFAPIYLLNKKRAKRREALEAQLIDCIGVLTNSLRAGHSFQAAMQTIATDMEAPISTEFGRVFRETQRGITLEDSLNQMVERMGSEDLGIMCTAIIIQRQVGGNLANVLENIAGTLQERISLKGEIKAKTASGRVSGYIVGGLPVFLLMIISVINPDYSAVLYNTTPGHMMLLVGIIMEVIGFMVIKKIVAIKY